MAEKKIKTRPSKKDEAFVIMKNLAGDPIKVKNCKKSIQVLLNAGWKK